MKKCKHIKIYSSGGVGTNVGTTVRWICKLCGEEGGEFRNNYDEYKETKRKFNKL